MKQKEKTELLWQLFEETGDPLCWMLYRREEKARAGTGSLSLK